MTNAIQSQFTPVPLTQSQLGMYLEWALDHTSLQYNICLDVTFPAGNVDPARLAKAVEQVFNAYPVFRLRLMEDAGEILQAPDETFTFAIACQNVADADIPDLQNAFRRPFDLFTEPMARAAVYVTPTQVHLFLDTFHLIMDGSNLQNLWAAILAAYEGRSLPAEDLSFLDYAASEARLFETPEYFAAKEAHATRFQGKNATVLEDSAGQAHTDYSVTLRLDERMPRAAVEDFCAQQGTTPNLFFMGAFARTLALYANQTEVTFFTVNHGRRDARLKHTMGAFVKTVPCLAELKGEQSLVDFLASLKLHQVGVYPLTHFYRDMKFMPELGFAFQDCIPDTHLPFGNACATYTFFSASGIGATPTMEVYGEKENYICRFSVASGRFTEKWCRTFLARYVEVARQFLAHPNAKLKDIPVVSASEASALMKISKGADLPYDTAATFVDLFERVAQKNVTACACVDCEGALDYATLSQRSQTLAARLAELGVQANSFVGVMLPRRTSFLVSALAVQRCGAGYVPLDPEYPADRLAYMLENAQAPVLITTHALFDSKGIPFAGRVLFYEDVDLSPVSTAVEVPHLAALTTPAYMIYTSGSTGKPKGVVIPQRGLAAFCAWVVQMMEIKPGHAVMVTPSFSFDASVFDLFPALTAGGTVHLLSEELRKDLAAIRAYVEEHHVDTAIMSTQMGLATLNAYPDIPLKKLAVGGERIVPFARTPVTVYNAYGPTEFTVASSYQMVDQDKGVETPIGYPVPNSYDFICDRLGQLVPRGFIGELCLAGIQIADGYWQLPEKTASVFVPCPFLAEGTRMYRTGDYACWNAEGSLDYRERIDQQVKLRGFRIEIGEIEHTAAACAGVTLVAAEVKEVSGTQHLVLYYTGTAEPDFLKQQMSETLTGYMVPDYFMRLDAMPLTPVGKIDRRALPLPTCNQDPVVEPETDLEKQILACVRAVLHTDDVGVTHDFYRIGLTSLGAMTLLAKLRKEAGLTVTLSRLATHPTVRQLAADLAAEAKDRGLAAVPVESKQRPKRRTYPMMENQRGIYVDWLRNPDTTQYNIPAAFRFPGLDGAKLVTAVQQVIAAHPALKTRFIEKDGEIIQERRDEAELPVTCEALDKEPDADFFATRMRPFAVTGEDLSRLTVFTTPAAAYLFLDIHHTIFDGFSLGVFLGDLMKALDGVAVLNESISAFDAALDERDYLESELVADDRAWFAKYLDGCESTQLEASEPGLDVPPSTAARVARILPATAVERRVRELGVSASDWFLASFMELLRRIGRSNDVQITFVSAGRAAADYSRTTGMFVRTLPVRHVANETTFSGVVRQLHKDVLALRDRERVSYAQLAEQFGLTPEIIFAFEGGLFDLPHNAEMIAPPTRTAKFPLSVTVTPGRDTFELAFEYDASRYSAHEMEAILGLYVTLSQHALQMDDLKSIPLVEDEQAEQIRALAYGGDLEYAANRLFIDLFHDVVLTRPLATAVVDADGAMSYGALHAAAVHLAAKLTASGVTPGAFVCIMTPRRRAFVVGVIAAHICGAGYVPLDSDYPDDRLAYMLEDSQAHVLLTTRAIFESKKLTFAGTIIYLDDEPFAQAATTEEIATAPTVSTYAHQAKGELPAYMIYTSGSTGKPKGVVVPQRALRHLIAWTLATRDFNYTTHLMQHVSFSFDASVIDIFPTLASGGELHILAEELRKDLPRMRDYVLQHHITNMCMSTQIGMTLIDTYPDLPIKDIMFGGEKLLPISPTAIALINGYGPTEFTVCSSYHIVDQSKTDDIPIGRAAPGTWSFIVDRYGHLLPQGLAGEIALAGPQIADGYWQLPEKTASVFITGPLMQAGAPMRLYRTGDLARYDAEGFLRYLGRIDFQVKLRGFRIEIGEIEHAASVFPGIKAVAAEVRDVGGAKHLVLYYSGEGTIDEQALKTELSRVLTSYMVPDYYVRLDEMPFTPNGKINRKRLPTPAAQDTASVYVAPRPGAETTIAEAWAEILKVERFSATDDFFLSGGTSLLGIKAVVALQKRGLEVQYGDLFKYKTPRALAAFLTGEAVPDGDVAAQAPAAFDYAAYNYAPIDGLFAHTRTELFEGFRIRALGEVLLTGATGYLGIHILRNLLETTSSGITLLIRPKGKASPERRLDATYVYYFGMRLPRRFKDRISFVAGDITDKDLATTLKDVEVSTVINCAALVKHYVADDRMDRINVGGVENLIAWCAQQGARLIQTSTYSIGGMVTRTSPAVLDERHLFVGQQSDNDYIRTKFLAERAVLAAIAEGKIRGKIMRLGNLMGREEDGEFQMNISANAFVNSLKSYKAIGAYPLEELASPMEMSPIDRVAEAICLLSTTPDDMVVFHPYNAYALDMGVVLGALNRRGYPIDYTSRTDFAAHVDAIRNDPRRADELQGILHYAQRHLGEVKVTPVQNLWTTTVLYRLGFRWQPAEDQYLTNFFNCLDGLAVFG